MPLTMSDPINLELLARHLQAIRAELRDMQFNAENDRRNIRSQFDNLAATHGSQLGDVEAKIAARLDALETLVADRFSYLDERIGSVEKRIGAVEERIGSVEKRIGSVEERLGALDQRFSGMDERISRLEAHAAHHSQRIDRLIVLVEQLAQGRQGRSR